MREGETIEGSRTMRNRPYPVLKCLLKLSHPPADGCDGCMTAIMRPGGWPGHSHRSHRPEDGCTGWKAAKMARAGWAEWLGSCNCSHAY